MKRDNKLSELQILKKIKKIINKNIISDKEISLNDYFFFTSWSTSLGEWNLKKILEKKLNLFYSIKSLLKYSLVYSIADLQNYKLSNEVEKNNKKNLIISYTNDSKILKYFDDYFSCEIKNSKKTHWFLINLDYFKNFKNLPKNLTLLSKQKNFFYFNYKFYFNIIRFLYLILFYKKKIKNDQFYKVLKIEIIKTLKKSKFSKVFIPYESQPHQHYIIKVLKSFNKRIEIIGYLHSSLTPLPTDFFFKKYYEPDQLIVHGSSQKEILIKYLGWKSKMIKCQNSFRYTKKSKSIFQSKLFLPFSLKSPSKLIFNLKIFLEFYRINIKKIEIINHPYMVNSRNHISFIKKIKNIKIQKNFDISKKKVAIVIGVSAIILEILENNIEVIHICSEPTYEKHSNEIWKNIEVKKLFEGVYSYKIKKKGTLINFGSKNNFVKKYSIY